MSKKSHSHMSLSIEYPIYLIPVPGGYASVVEQQPDGDQLHWLAVFLSADTAMEFVQKCELPDEPRPLNNAREFRWFLQSLKKPVTQVAFDPSAESKAVSARWKVSVAQLLRHEIVADQSPWNYPVFVIAQDVGFASIDGASDAGQPIHAVGMFTTRKKADTYLKAADESGTVLAIDDLQQARSFLSALQSDTPAVALDPVVHQDRRIAKYAFRVDLLLEKYLVEVAGDPTGKPET